MRTRDMEDAQGSYNHEDEIKGLHISMGNVETESNGHRSKVEPMELVETMRSLQKEVQSYREDNERLIRAQEEQNQINTQLLQSLNMLQRQINKYFGTKQAANARQVETSRSHDRRDDQRGSRNSRSAIRHHHSLGHSTRRDACSKKMLKLGCWA
jgi:hypothetical protein